MPIRSAYLPAVATEGRLDIRFGGSPEEIYRESVAVTKAYLSTLPPDQTVFYLNTLVPQPEMLADMFYIRHSLRSTRMRNRFHVHTIEPDELIQKQKLWMTMIREYHIRVLVLNSFDFAATSAKARRKLFLFLKLLRDFQHLHIVLYVRQEVKPSMPGWPGELAWLASSVSELDRPCITFRRREAKFTTTNPTVGADGAIEQTQSTHTEEIFEIVPPETQPNQPTPDPNLENLEEHIPTTLEEHIPTTLEEFLIHNRALKQNDLAHPNGYPSQENLTQPILYADDLIAQIRSGTPAARNGLLPQAKDWTDKPNWSNDTTDFVSH